ncbi:paraquat-inducible protein A [Thioclava sp. BHET1]|nr:paraquat-inducible protein A [Thioclava sp. BHET1]
MPFNARERDVSGRAEDLSDLRACPHCDTLYKLPKILPRQRGRCPRCHALLLAPRNQVITRVIALAFTALVLMAGAMFWPFLDLSAQGREAEATIFDAVEAYDHGLMFPLSLAVGAFIVVLPALRLSLLLYTLLPMMAGKRPWPRAGQAFRIAEAMRPWSMAEIFLIGVVVALVKVAGLAAVHPGPAFWALCGLVMVTVLQDMVIDKESIWNEIELRKISPGNNSGRNETQ